MQKFKFINLLATFALLITVLLPVTSVGAEKNTAVTKQTVMTVAEKVEASMQAQSVKVSNAACDSSDPTCDTYQKYGLGVKLNHALDTSISVGAYYYLYNVDTNGIEFHFYLDGVLKGIVPYDESQNEEVNYEIENLQPETEYEVEIRMVQNGVVIESQSFPVATIASPLYFEDAGLEQAVKDTLGVYERPLELSDIQGLVDLYAYGYGIKSIEGLEDATSLLHLDIEDNLISDLSPIANLTQLEYLFASYNQITDISPIDSLENLVVLLLNGNKIDDFTPIATKGKLVSLGISTTGVTDVWFVTQLKNLQTLSAWGNNIWDISSMVELDQLVHLDISDNKISELAILTALSTLEFVDISNNPLNENAVEVINQLLANGVEVWNAVYEHEEPTPEPSVYTWVYENNKWYYEDQYGNLKTGWVQDGAWYYLDENGAMVENNWAQDGGLWYYLGKGGAMVTNNWVKSGATWYYVDAKGVMLENKWVQSGGLWYYMGKGGAMVTNNWVQDGAWYFMDGSGVMVTNKWISNGGSWYFMSKSGKMSTGWLSNGGSWYYLTPSGGKMATGWQVIGGTWYYFYSSGKMAYNTTIGGYKLNASGAWVR